jgi:Multiubiquitin
VSSSKKEIETMDTNKAPGHKSVTIIVNTREKVVEKDDITFGEVVALAFDPVPSGPNVLLTVTYHRGQGNKSGDLLAGQSVKVKDEMVFDVTATDLS